MDKLVARNPLHFNLLSTSPDFFIDENQFLFAAFILRNQMFKEDDLSLNIFILNIKRYKYSQYKFDMQSICTYNNKVYD